MRSNDLLALRLSIGVIIGDYVVVVVTFPKQTTTGTIHDVIGRAFIQAFNTAVFPSIESYRRDQIARWN